MPAQADASFALMKKVLSSRESRSVAMTKVSMKRKRIQPSVFLGGAGMGGGRMSGVRGRAAKTMIKTCDVPSHIAGKEKGRDGNHAGRGD
jgi:hypothetical protein